MRKFMKKEVVFTVAKSAKMEVVAGFPKAIPNQDITLLGKVNQTNCDKEVKAQFGDNSMVYSVETFTKNYRMKVEDFIKYAEEVQADMDDTDEDEEEGEDNE